MARVLASHPKAQERLIAIVAAMGARKCADATTATAQIASAPGGGGNKDGVLKRSIRNCFRSPENVQGTNHQGPENV